jgi:hypothetical protein
MENTNTKEMHKKHRYVGCVEYFLDYDFQKTEV